MASFAELGIVPEIVRALDEMGYEEPSPVQERAIPSMLQGRDVVVQALTGTGKTAAFGVPLVQQIDPRLVRIQAIVLAPTRELAVQVSESLTAIARHRPIWVVPIYGGQPMGRQLNALRRGVHVVVATPGRFLDHLRRETISLDRVRMLVLDEADLMLEMGFHEDVTSIIEQLPTERQTALFSATVPPPIVELARQYLREPETIRLSRPRALTVPETEQAYLVLPFPRKTEGLVRVLEAEVPERTLVFCATKRMVDSLTEELRGRGFRAAGLHGDMTQATREATLSEFRRGLVDVLTATDVAARGLDIPDVSLVVNFDIPMDAESYTHRIGRTGRMGKRGEAITFVNPREMRELQVIERITGARIRRRQLPTATEVAEREREILVERVGRELESGRWGQYRELVEELSDEHDPINIAAAALALVAQQPRRAPAAAAVRRA
ncbi:MAG: DEAD/DEAH box helicase [Chloroflexota bacterium]